MDNAEKLLHVRRANRLLASYYRRVLDVLRLMQAEMASHRDARLSFKEWSTPRFRRIVGRQTTPILDYNQWAWDYLPLTALTLVWSSNGKDGPSEPGAVRVSVHHTTDTGMEDWMGDDHKDRYPDPTDFPEADRSRSEIRVWMYGLAAGTCPSTWAEMDEIADEALDEAQTFDGAVHALAVDLFEGTDDAVVRYFGWKVDLAEIADESDVERLLLEPLRTALTAVVA